jgi:hypothetical protein
MSNNNNSRQRSGEGSVPMDWQPTANKDQIAHWLDQCRRTAANDIFQQAMRGDLVELREGDESMSLDDLTHIGHLLQSNGIECILTYHGGQAVLLAQRREKQC